MSRVLSLMNGSFVWGLSLLTCVGVACAEKPVTRSSSPSPPPPTATASVTTAASAPPLSAPAPSEGWSAVVGGVRGRLVVTKAPPSRGGPQVQMDLELENVTAPATPLEVFWDYPGSMLKLSVEDETGNVLPVVATGGNWAAPPPRFVTLKPGPDAVMRTSISSAAYEYVPDGRTLFRPLTFQAWTMPATRSAKLYVSGVLTPPTSPDGARKKAWTGPLALPRVALP